MVGILYVCMINIISYLLVTAFTFTALSLAFYLFPMLLKLSPCTVQSNCVVRMFWNICLFVNLQGGRQFKVTKNDLIVIHRIPAEVGSQIVLEKVKMVIVIF